MTELLSQVRTAQASGQAFYGLSYKLTRTDDLSSAMQRHEDALRQAGFQLSEWSEDSPGVKGQHSIRAAVIWDDKGKEAALRSGYQFAPEFVGPSEEEQAEVEARLAEIQTDPQHE